MTTRQITMTTKPITMTSKQITDAFIERPEYFLALMFSIPDGRTAMSIPSVTVDFTESEVIARVQRPTESRAPRLLATKQTIFAAVLLHHLIVQRGQEFAASLVEQSKDFSRRAAYHNAEFPLLDQGCSPNAESSAFFQELAISTMDLEAAGSKTKEALGFLEEQDLAIDPAFTPELMVLVGLVPMQFSVRTPKGERIYREIKVNAPLWSLDISQGNKNGENFTDVEFRIRGIEIVRKAITAMATEYLESEEDNRRRKGQPVLQRNGKPKLDGE